MFTESMMLFRSMANNLQDLSLPSYQKNMRMLTQIHSYIMEMRSFHLTLSASASGPVSVQEEPLVDLADAARAVTTTLLLHPRNLVLVKLDQRQPLSKILRDLFGLSLAKIPWDLFGLPLSKILGSS